MTVAKQIKEVAGWLNAAGHDLRRAQGWENRAAAAGVKPLVWRARKWDR